MTESDDPFFRYETHSRAFLERAKSNLGLFRNSGDPEMLFRSALHLRYGIEGRLNEYIAATLEICGRADKKISDYSATKLLKRLRMLTPKTQDRMFVRFSAGANEPSTTLEYIPVSSILASVHGQLGELLHHNFFINNPNWMLKSQSVPNSRRETA